MTETTIGRHFFFDQMKKQVAKSGGGFYPALDEIMGVLKDNFQKSDIDHFTDEAARFAKLAATPQSDALIGLFHGTNAVKKHSFGKPSHPIQNIAVLGAGLMGAGIATVSVDNGKYRVLLKDKDLAGVTRGEKIIDDALQAKLTKKRITKFEYTETSSRLIPLHDDIASWKKHFGRADMVIEGIYLHSDFRTLGISIYDYYYYYYQYCCCCYHYCYYYHCCCCCYHYYHYYHQYIITNRGP